MVYMHAGSVVAVGMGATLVVDVWSLIRRRLFGQALPNWALVGRWFGHLVRGTVTHQRIANAAPVRGELAIGWVSHYVVGIAFALLLSLLAGVGWLEKPAPAPALAFGLATVAAPFFILQPGMGLGFAGSRTPRPAATRIQSLITHAVFGCGLYVSAHFVRQLEMFP